MDAKTAGRIKKTAAKKTVLESLEPDESLMLEEGYEPSKKKSLAQCFVHCKRVHVEIPRGYKHSTCIEAYNKRRGRFDNIDSRITDETYLLATNMLLPGRSYTIVIDYVNAVINSKDCIKYIEEKGGTFINAQGITFIAEQIYNDLPTDAWVVAFDKPTRLPKIDGEARVAMIRRTPGQGHSIMLGNFSGKWRPRFVGEAGHAIVYVIED